MSIRIEKFKPSFEPGNLKKETKPYTQILNKVLQECDDLNVLGLWCHLQSRPENWIISPQNIQNHFKIGKEKAYDLLNKLIKFKLLTREYIKNPNGTYKNTEYTLHDGHDYVNNQCSDPLPGFPYPAEPYPANQDTTNKRLKQTKDNTNLILCSSDDEQITVVKKKKKKKTIVPDDFLYTKNHIAFAKAKNIDIDHHKREFIEHFKLKGEKRLDWRKSFCTWLTNANKWRMSAKTEFPNKIFQPHAVLANVENQSNSRSPQQIQEMNARTVRTPMPDSLRKMCNLKPRSNENEQDQSRSSTI